MAFNSLFAFGVAAICTVYSVTATSQEPLISSITLPVSIDLAKVERRVNAELPTRLATIKEDNMHCVPAEWASAKVPCVKRWKLTSCVAKTKITPDIYCDVSGYVDRRGNISFNGAGETITVSFPVYAKISAKAGVSETADAKATFFVTAIPSINSNWKPSIEVKSDFRWDKRPQLKLFNFIKITIGSKVEPKLREKMAEFEARVPVLLDELNVRDEVEAAWLKAQEPIQISTSPDIYLTFTPTRIGFSEISVDGKIFRVNVVLEGKTQVRVGAKPKISPVALLPIETMSSDNQSFKVPILWVVTQEELQRTIDENFQDGIVIDLNEENLIGFFSARNFKVELSESTGITLSAEVDFDKLELSGTLQAEFMLKNSFEQKKLLVKDFRINIDTNNKTLDTILALVILPNIRDKIAKGIEYDYSNDLKTAIEEANKALNIVLDEDVNISGNIAALGIGDLSIQNELIALTAIAEGNVELSLKM